MTISFDGRWIAAGFVLAGLALLVTRTAESTAFDFFAAVVLVLSGGSMLVCDYVTGGIRRKPDVLSPADRFDVMRRRIENDR